MEQTRRVIVPLLIVILFAVAWLVPTVGLFVQSLRDAADVSATGWWTVFANPAQLTLEPYRDLLSDPVIQRAVFNTIGITVPTTVLLVLFASMAAYGLSCLRFRGRNVLFTLVIALLVVPTQVALIPTAQLFARLGIFGSIPGVVLFHLGFGLPFGVLLLRNIFVGVPRDIIESARVDGATHVRIFASIVAPIGVPGIASLSIFQFVWVWNDLLVSLVFADASTAPLTAAIRQQMRNFSSNIDIIAPGAFVQLVIPVIVFLGFQRYFIKGLTAGATKG